MMNMLQKQVFRTVGPTFPPPPRLLAHCQNVASLLLFCRYYFERYLSEMTELVSLPGS